MGKRQYHRDAKQKNHSALYPAIRADIDGAGKLHGPSAGPNYDSNDAEQLPVSLPK
jgi:hypothetical protein